MSTYRWSRTLTLASVQRPTHSMPRRPNPPASPSQRRFRPDLYVVLLQEPLEKLRGRERDVGDGKIRSLKL
jgi:hypothetical protein